MLRALIEGCTTMDTQISAFYDLCPEDLWDDVLCGQGSISDLLDVSEQIGSIEALRANISSFEAGFNIIYENIIQLPVSDAFELLAPIFRIEHETCNFYYLSLVKFIRDMFLGS